MSDALERLPLACPLDGLALVPSGGAFACAHGHAYDVARHGYVNLLPVQFKPSRDPGDDAAMVAARRRVLDAGVFDPLAEAVAERVRDVLWSVWEAASNASNERSPRDDERGGSESSVAIVDAGCGEGFYTARIAGHLWTTDAFAGARVLGADISVHAIRAAARRHADVGWVVANNTRLPLLAGRVDVVTSLFGFETWAPWSALQRRGQHVVVAHAGPRHLIELREAIYDDVRIHDPPSDAEAIAAGYETLDEHRITFGASGVTPERLADVLAMTPHGHRATGDASAVPSALAERVGFGTSGLTIDVVLRSHRRC